jgi:glutamate-1-semialdehyde aminotransferase
MKYIESNSSIFLKFRDKMRRITRSKGKGAKVYDTLNREYIDYTMGWWSVTLGHRHPKIYEAVMRQAKDGTNFSHVSEPLLKSQKNSQETQRFS